MLQCIYNDPNYSKRYYQHEAAARAISYISGTKLDNRIIRADWDVGFVEGRQFGRGRTGGQVRDDYRQELGYFFFHLTFSLHQDGLR